MKKLKGRMTPKQMLGFFLLASPFIGIGIFSLFCLGLAQTIAIFAFVLLIIIIVFTGCYLIEDAK